MSTGNPSSRKKSKQPRTKKEKWGILLSLISRKGLKMSKFVIENYKGNCFEVEAKTKEEAAEIYYKDIDNREIETIALVRKIIVSRSDNNIYLDPDLLASMVEDYINNGFHIYFNPDRKTIEVSKFSWHPDKPLDVEGFDWAGLNDQGIKYLWEAR